MTEVLVLVDHAASEVRKPALELLALARRIGEPVAVVLEAGATTAAERLAEHGATAVLVSEQPELEQYLVAPKVDALVQIAQQRQPAAVLVTSSAEGKEIAARAALRRVSGLVTDAVDVASDGTATQSVFAGSYSVQS